MNQKESIYINIEEVGLNTRTVNTLLKAGVLNAMDLRYKSEKELQEIKGIGKKMSSEIVITLKKFTPKVLFVINNKEDIQRLLEVEKLTLTDKGEIKISYTTINQENNKPPMICVNVSGKELYFKSGNAIVRSHFKSGAKWETVTYILQ